MNEYRKSDTTRVKQSLGRHSGRLTKPSYSGSMVKVCPRADFLDSSQSKGLLAELMQMSRVSQQEEGLLNHAQAGAVIGVSARRVAELVELGRLTRYDFLGRTYVSVREVLERRNAEVKAGRPARSTRDKVRTIGKILTNYDVPNLVVDAITPDPVKKKPRRK